jgi:hypothetical protein
MFPSSKWKKTKTKNESKSNWWAPIWHFISSVFHRSFSKSYIQNSERVVCETRLLVRVYLLLELEQQTGTRQYAVDLYTKVLHDFVYYPMDTRRSRYKLIFFLSVTKENNERPSNKWNRRNKNVLIIDTLTKLFRWSLPNQFQTRVIWPNCGIAFRSCGKPSGN